MEIEWVAELDHVLEVSLAGSASLDPWRERLRAEKLVPREVDGRTEVMIVGADARFRGIRFQEVSVSVVVEGDGDRAFLIEAYNSRRFFAFVERAFFRTPYRHARVGVRAGAISVDGVLEAEMASRAPASAQHEEWNGTVFLPNGRLFHARLSGETERYPFLPADRLTTRFDFRAREWRIRRDAKHAKSKTYAAAAPIGPHPQADKPS